MGKNKFLGKSLSLIGSAAAVGSALGGANASANLLDDTLEKSFMYKFFRFLNLTWFMNKISERAICSLKVGIVLNDVLALVEKEFTDPEEKREVVILGEDQKHNKNVVSYYFLNSSNNKYGFYFGDDEYILFEIIEKNNKDKPRIYGKRVFSFNRKTGDTKEALDFLTK